MSRPKRKTVASMMEEAELGYGVMPPQPDEVVQRSRDQVTEPSLQQSRHRRDRRDRPGDVVRNGYHASVYLPKEAQFAVREIALHLRHVKPHAVFLEAFADLFDKYHKPDLAAECRSRIDPRDSVEK